MTITATMPFCHTAPPMAVLGLALQKIIISAAAAIIVICMTMFMESGCMTCSVTPSTTTPALASRALDFLQTNIENHKSGVLHDSTL